MTKITPIGDVLFVSPDAVPTMTKSGLALPENWNNGMVTGKVVSAGAGKTTENGEVIPMPVKAGQTILFNQQSVVRYNQDDKELYLVRQSAILGVVE
jgi:chaperonin GroES